MSMRGSLNWWKDRRHTSHSGIPTVSRPATAWNGSPVPDPDLAHDQKIIEQAVLAAFDSDAFRSAILSQLDPTNSKLNQIKTSNLNLESSLQTHVDAFQSHLTVSDQHYETIFEEQKSAQGQLKEIPTLLRPIQDLVSLQAKFQEKMESQLDDLFSGQAKVLKSMETRFDSLESRIEDIDGKIDHFEQAVVDADLRSAIRFGEISNELQDRNTLLGDRIWEVQRDLGKKVDGQQRKVLGVCEEMAKHVQGVNDSVETMQVGMEEQFLKAVTRIEASEKNLKEKLVAIQEKVVTMPSIQEMLENGLSELSKALEDIKGMSESTAASSASRFEDIVSGIARLEPIVKSTNQISQDMSKSQAKAENIDPVQKQMESLASSHSESLQHIISTTTRIEEVLTALDTAALGKLDNLEKRLTPLYSYDTKLDDLRSALGNVPQRSQMDELRAAILEMKSNVGGAFESQDATLDSIQQNVRNVLPLRSLMTQLSDMRASFEQKLSVQEEKQDGTLKVIEELKSITTVNRGDISGRLDSIVELGSTKEDVTTLQSKIQQILAANSAVMDEINKFQPVITLSDKLDEVSASVSSSSRDMENAIRASAKATEEYFQNLDANLDGKIASMTENTHERVLALQEPLDKVLRQVEASEAALKTAMDAGHEITRNAVHFSASKQTEKFTSVMTTLDTIQGLHGDAKILQRIDSMEQSFIAKQETAAMAIVAMLEDTQKHDETSRQSITDLGTICSHTSEILHMLDTKFEFLNEEMKSTITENQTSTAESVFEITEIMKTVQVDVRSIRDNPTSSTIKQLLLQNASSMATAYEGILAIDSKIKTNGDRIQSALQDMQSTLSRDILDASSSITSSVADGLGDVKIDLASRISTSTNVLRVEMKRIDISPTIAALDSLEAELQSLSRTAHKDRESMIETMNSRLQVLVDSLTKVISGFGEHHGKKLEENTKALSEIEDKRSTSHAERSEKIQTLLESVLDTNKELRTIITAVQRIDDTSKSSATNLSNLQKLAEKSTSELESLSKGVIAAIEVSATGTKDAMKNSHTILQQVQSLSSRIPSLLEGQKTLEVSILKESESNRDLIASSSAATSAEVLAVKSEVGGIITSLKQADEERRGTDKSLASILSTIKQTSLNIHQVQSSLEKAEASGKEASDILKRDISTLGEILSNDISTLQGSTLREMGSVKENIQKSAGDIDAKVTDASAEAARMYKATLAAVKSVEKLTRCNEERLVDVEHNVVSEIQLVKENLVEDLRSINSTAQDLRIGLEGILTEVDSVANEAAENRDALIAAIRSDSGSLRQSITTEVEKIGSVVEAGQKLVISQFENTKISLKSDVGATKASIEEAKKMVESMSSNVRGGFENVASQTARVHQAISAHQSGTKSMADSLLREAQNTGSSIENIKIALAFEVQDTKKALSANITEMERSIQHILEDVSSNVSTGFSEAMSQRREFKLAHEAKLTAMTENINHTASATQNHLESAHNRTVAELQTTGLNLKTSLDGLKLDFGSVSKTIQSANSAVKMDIDSLCGKTVDGFSTLEGSIKHTNAAVGRRIGDTETSLQSNLETISGSIRSVDAAVRVNSAAIARVDKAVLETGSQVKSVVIDGNRDIIFQLEEELHENGSRIRGISEFDIPRIEALGKRNRIALEVIGARVLGTAKKFEEVVNHQSQKELKGLEHSELLNGRLRGGSNASSRDSGLRASGVIDR